MRNLDIWAACAISDSGFAISVGDLEDGPQFSRLCIYNASGMPGWRFVPFESTLVSLARLEGGSDGSFVAALGIDGDFHTVGRNIVSEQIPDAGAGDEEQGRGSMSQIRFFDGNAIACGYGSQVYVRNRSGVWALLCGEDIDDVGDNCFEASAKNSANQYAACGYSASEFRSPTAEEQAELDRIAATGTMREYLSAKERFESQISAERGCLFVMSGRSWRPVQLPGNGYLNDIIVLQDGKFLAVGGGGLAVAGIEPEFFEDKSQPGFLETYHAACVLNGRPHLLADTVVQVLDDNLDLAEEFSLPDGLGSPLLVDAADDTLWYFDNKGVARRLNDRWEVIVFPDEVWDQDTGQDNE